MPGYRRSYLRRAIAMLAILLLAALRLWSESQAPSDGPLPPAAAELPPGVHVVERVVDGDTLLLTERRRVRLQGIDCPETVKPNAPVEPWGPEASAFTKEFIRAAGNRARIEFDGERFDVHGRYLAFVWDGDRLLNEELVRAGLARARLHYDYSMAKKEMLSRAQRAAQDAGRGIWSAK